MPMAESGHLPPVSALADCVAYGGARRELWGWCAVAIGSLAIAGAFAFLLALSRVPGIETVFPWPLGFFHKGLVIHVVFSFVVFFLAVFAALVVTVGAAGDPLGRRSTGRSTGLGSGAVWCMALALPLLFVPALLDRGEATLNNYVPTIIDPLYYTGLVIMAAAVALPALRFLLTAGRARSRTSGDRSATGPLIVAVAAAAVTYLLAIACFAIAWLLLAGFVPGHEAAGPPSHAFNEELFWGGGHVLQFLNTQVLILAWVMLAAVAGRRAGPVAWAGATASVLLTVAAAAAPIFYVVYEPFVAEQTLAFTNLQYALGPAAAIVLAAIALAPRADARGSLPVPPMPEAGQEAARAGQAGRAAHEARLAVLCLALSAALFAVGGAFGLFVDGADTRTPAHYHGVIAAVTVAVMGLFYIRFLPALGRAAAQRKVRTVQLSLFSGGQLTACIGLFLAGGFGAPRKTAGAAQGLEGLGATIGMAMNGIGALIAIIGGIMFIWLAGAALIGARPAQRRPMAKPLGTET